MRVLMFSVERFYQSRWLKITAGLYVPILVLSMFLFMNISREIAKGSLTLLLLGYFGSFLCRTLQQEKYERYIKAIASLAGLNCVMVYLIMMVKGV